MLIREARWFERQLRSVGDAALFPMLNVGSQTADFRTREQPWIDRHVFAPLRQRGGKVVHLDLQAAPGVDVVGDLTEPGFRAEIAATRFRSAFCSNLMEHVTNREEIGRAVVDAVEPGGFLFVSCPNVFPYHPDPIDTMYRPGVDELAELFPDAAVVQGERLRCGTLTTYLASRFLGDPTAVLRMLFRRRKQVVSKTHAGLSAMKWMPWLWRGFYQTCAILKKSQVPQCTY